VQPKPLRRAGGRVSTVVVAEGFYRAEGAVLQVYLVFDNNPSSFHIPKVAAIWIKQFLIIKRTLFL